MRPRVGSAVLLGLLIFLAACESRRSTPTPTANPATAGATTNPAPAGAASPAAASPAPVEKRLDPPDAKPAKSETPRPEIFVDVPVKPGGPGLVSVTWADCLSGCTRVENARCAAKLVNGVIHVDTSVEIQRPRSDGSAGPMVCPDVCVEAKTTCPTPPLNKLAYDVEWTDTSDDEPRTGSFGIDYRDGSH